MLENIRKKVASVLHDRLSIPEGLSVSHIKTNQTLSGSRTELGIPPDINLNAGCNVLQDEGALNEIHDANEINTQKLMEIDKIVQRIKSDSQAKYMGIMEVSSALAGVTSLVEKLKVCNNLINTIPDLIKNVKVKLTELEELNVEYQRHEQKMEHKKHLSLYKQKEIEQLQTLRKELAAEHVQEVKNVEHDQLKKTQLERQAVFQEAFLCDLETYIESGSIPKIELAGTATDNQLSLEEISLDDVASTEELEDFLKDD